ncbi:MAG: hypothetical protein HYV63_30480 [Candidatus Schekmanbacteria bacterium]|nr:hypothetical protein [Candidatus Schekmanbacteria bacterium]
MMRGRILTTFLALSLIAAGCTNVKIDSPKNGGLYPDAPDFKVSYNSEPSGLTLKLNGTDVTSFFAVGSAAATASGDALAAYVLPGDNQFEVTRPSFVSPVQFHFDVVGPTVKVTSVDEASPLVVHGRVEDPAGVARLSCNGAAVTVSGGSFTATVANAAFVGFEAEDGFGHVSTTTFARPGTALGSSMGARLNKSGIAFLVAEISNLLGKLDFGELIKELNPLFDKSIGVASARVDATDVEISAPKVSLAVSPSNDGTFDVGVDISDLVVYVHATGTVIGIPWETDGVVWADLVSFDGKAKVTVTNQKIGVALSNLSLVLNGFGFDISGFPDVLEGLFFDLVGDLLEGFIRDELATRIPPYIEEFLKNIPSDFQIDLDGHAFRIAALPQALTTKDEGMSVHLAASVSTLTPVDVPPALGSLYVAGATPDLGTKTPGGKAFDAGAVVSGNLINQALLEGYRAGLTHVGLDEQTNPRISPAGLRGIGMEIQGLFDGDDVRFNVLPSSPPYAGIRGTQTALAALAMDEFTFELELRKQGTDDWLLVFGAVLDMNVPFLIGVSDNNTVKVTFEEVPTVKIRDIDDRGVIDLDEKLVQAIIDWLLPLALPYLADIVEEIKIPSYEGYGVWLHDLFATGSSTDYIAFAGNLVKDSTRTRAARPETYVLVEDVAYTSRSFATEVAPDSALDGKLVTVYVAGDVPGASVLQYSYRLDSGEWSVWRERTEIHLRHLLAGDHVLEVRSRTPQLAVDPTPARVVFRTGPESYRLTLGRPFAR